MRKKLLLLSAIIAVVSLTFVLSACNKKGSDEYSNVSRTVLSYSVGESENFAVGVETGRREKSFLADGIATDVVDFAEITVTPLKTHDYTAVDFALTDGSSVLSGTVNSDDFGEFKLSLTALEFIPVSVTLTAGELAETVDLQNMLENALTAADVINVAEKEFAERIAEEKASDDGFHREVYVKMISGDRENYYYYVSYIGDGVDYWAILVNPQNGEVVSKK